MTVEMRCQVCGGFYEGAECPQNHPAAATRLAVGMIVRYGSSLYMVVSPPDDDGEVGLSPLHERVRAPMENLKEIT